jgi:membrane fusion protein, multidrug efflux system
MKMKTPVYESGRLIALIVGVGVMGLTLAGCGKQKGAGGPPGGGVPEVAVATIQPERLTLNTELPGRVSAFLVAEIRPQVSGIIQKRLFEEGADVKAGDPLYQIDPAMYEASHSAAKAAQARAEASLASIRSRAARYKELVDVKAVSQQDYDDITNGIKQVEAEVAAGKAAAESARLNLSFTSITAPISGRIGRSSVTIGALATAYQPVPFTTIQQLDNVYVDAPQSSANLLRLKKTLAGGNLKSDGAGQAKVRLLLEDGTAYPQEGAMQFSDVTVDPSTGSFNLRMIFPNPDRVLLPGMFVRAVVPEGINEQAILIPQQAVARDPRGNPMAMIVSGEGKVEPRPLVLDRAIGNRWLVASGLRAGDSVIVEGILRARPGSPVKAVPFEKAGTGKEPVGRQN